MGKYKNCEKQPQLENNEIVLVHNNFVNIKYQTDSRDFYIFISIKLFAQLSDILPTNFNIFY